MNLHQLLDIFTISVDDIKDFDDILKTRNSLELWIDHDSGLCELPN